MLILQGSYVGGRKWQSLLNEYRGAAPRMSSTCALYQLADGRVKNVSAATAGELLADGFVLLDVRPPEEVARVST